MEARVPQLLDKHLPDSLSNKETSPGRHGRRVADGADTAETSPNDGELVRRSAGGDAAAFDGLVRRHQRQAAAVSFRLLGNTADAQEVVQEAFLKAYVNLDSLERPDAFAGWLMRIVSNVSLNFRRGRKVRKAGPLGEENGGSADEPAEEAVVRIDEDGPWRGPSRAVDPLRAVASSELGERLTEALAKLPEKQRNALVLFTLQGMPQRQVADALQCSVEAVKWHVFQARKRLKEMLGDYL